MTEDRNDDLPDDLGDEIGEEGGEEGGEEEGKSGGDDHATLALNTPEPAQAIAAAEQSLKGKGKPQRKGRKARAGVKSAMGGAFAKVSADGLGEGGSFDPDAKSTALGVHLDERMFGLEDITVPAAEAPEESDLSAFDRDEITDPGEDGIDPLQVLLGSKEKPWENEKLTAAEKAALRQVYQVNDPAAQQEREQEETGPDGKGSATKRAAAAAATVAAAGILGMKTAHAAHRQQVQHHRGPAVAGVAKGPRREADQDAVQAQGEGQKQTVEAIAAAKAEEVKPAPADETALGVGILVGMPTSSALLYRAATQNYGESGYQTGFVPEVQSVIYPNIYTQSPDGTLTRNPEGPFMQALQSLYQGLGPNTLNAVSPDRQTGWETTRLLQRENSADVTGSVVQPAPDPALNRGLQMNVGPGGMG